MAQVKASLWCITNNPLPVQDVRVSGHIEDFRGYFTLVQTYYTRKTQKGDVDLLFQFFLQDLGLVVGYSVLVGGEQVDAIVKLKPELEQYEDLLKQNIDPSASDSLVCQLSKVPSDTRIEVRIQFIQTLRLEDGQTFSLNFPTTVSPKTYFHEPQKEGFETSLRQFGFSMDINAKNCSFGKLTAVESPSHPVELSEGSIRIKTPEANQFLSDSNVVLFLKYDKPVTDSLTKSLAHKTTDGDYVVMVSTVPQFDVAPIEVKEDDEEGHPDPREILFIIDTNQSEMAEVKDILASSLDRLDMQAWRAFSSSYSSVPLQFYHPWKGPSQDVPQKPACCVFGNQESSRVS